MLSVLLLRAYTGTWNGSRRGSTGISLLGRLPSSGPSPQFPGPASPISRREELIMPAELPLWLGTSSVASCAARRLLAR